jgi:hypothetical protein
MSRGAKQRHFHGPEGRFLTMVTARGHASRLAAGHRSGPSQARVRQMSLLNVLLTDSSSTLRKRRECLLRIDEAVNTSYDPDGRAEM